MTAMLAAEGRISSRQARAVEIAATLDLDSLDARPRDGVYVPSQSADREYRVRYGRCNCPDAGKGNECKHVMALALLPRYGELLAQRLDTRWSGDLDDVAELEADYRALLVACAGYQPPAEGLLTAYRLEALGDDEHQKFRPLARQGRPTPDIIKPPSPWVARITGACSQYEFARDFIRGHKDYRDSDKLGRSGVWVYYELSPGLYEINEVLRGARSYRSGVSQRFFARVANLTVTRIDKAEVLACLRSEPS